MPNHFPADRVFRARARRERERELASLQVVENTKERARRGLTKMGREWLLQKLSRSA